MDTSLEYMSVDEAAALWKVQSERIIYTCECDGIEGAAKLSGKWIIPSGMPRPKIKMLPKPLSKAEKNALSIGRTKKQQALVDGFEGGGTPFAVTEHKIGNTTYIVTSVSAKSAKRTAAELTFSAILRAADSEGILKTSVAEREKILKDFRKDEIERQPSFEEYMKKTREFLTAMDFCNEDIEMLLEKYAANYKLLEEM